jgi:hypothetical protein
VTLPDGLDKDFDHFIRKGSNTVRTKGTHASGRLGSRRVCYGESRRAIIPRFLPKIDILVHLLE